MTDLLPPAASAAQSQPPPSAPPTQHPRRVSRRLFGVAMIAAVALILTGVTTAITRYIYDQRPAGVITRYFDALADGDASAALGFGDLPAGSRDLLTPTVLAAQLSNGEISNVAIMAATEHGSQAQVDVQYVLSGLTFKKMTIIDRISLVREHGDWRLSAVAVPYDLAFTGASDRISIGGQRVPTGRYLIFPGAAPFHIDTPTLQLTRASSVVRLSGTSTGFMLEPSTPGVRPMQMALAKAFAQCMAWTAPVQAACPAPSAGIRAVPGSFRGTTSDDLLSKQLRFSVDQQNAVGVILATSTVTVTGTLEQLDFNNIATPAQYHGTMTVSAYAMADRPDVIYWGAP